MINTTLYRLDAFRRHGQRWTPVLVTGETRLSWIAAGGGKIDKRTLKLRDGGAQLYTADERDVWERARVERSRLLRLIELADDHAILRYAALLGEG